MSLGFLRLRLLCLGVEGVVGALVLRVYELTCENLSLDMWWFEATVTPLYGQETVYPVLVLILLVGFTIMDV